MPDVCELRRDLGDGVAELQPYSDVFRDAEKLDAYAMCLDDMQVFEDAGYQRNDIGRLSTYGCVLHSGVLQLFQGVADRAFVGDLAGAVDGKTFLDLGSAEGRCILSAALHFGNSCRHPCLHQAVGIELSALRHGLAQKHLARVRDAEVRDRVTLLQGDILAEEAAHWVGQADVIYAANLHFPPEVNEQIGRMLEEKMNPEKEVFVLELASLGFQPHDEGTGENIAEKTRRKPADSWDIQVSMSWNPDGWPVHCHRFPAKS